MRREKIPALIFGQPDRPAGMESARRHRPDLHAQQGRPNRREHFQTRRTGKGAALNNKSVISSERSVRGPWPWLQALQGDRSFGARATVTAWPGKRSSVSRALAQGDIQGLHADIVEPKMPFLHKAHPQAF